MFAMLRTMLADRFKVRVHEDTREMPIYTLVKARNDGKLGEHVKPSTTDCAALMGFARTFEVNQRASLDWRLDVTNVLNVLTYTGVDPIAGGSQFGLPNAANTPRKILMTVRMRFSK